MNLDYNYFRDYDPAIGRYVQSDPIGLDGGLNTYGYVGGTPLLAVDPFGLREPPGDSSGALPWPGRSLGEAMGREKPSCEVPCRHPVTLHHSTGRSGVPKTKTYDWVCLVIYAAIGKVGGSAVGNAVARGLPNMAEGLGMGAKAVGGRHSSAPHGPTHILA